MCLRFLFLMCPENHFLFSTRLVILMVIRLTAFSSIISNLLNMAYKYACLINGKVYIYQIVIMQSLHRVSYQINII